MNIYMTRVDAERRLNKVPNYGHCPHPPSMQDAEQGKCIACGRFLEPLVRRAA